MKIKLTGLRNIQVESVYSNPYERDFFSYLVIRLRLVPQDGRASEEIELSERKQKRLAPPF